MGIEVTKLRGYLKSAMRELSSDGPVSNDQIISHLRQKNPEILRPVRTYLEDTALKRILNGLAKQGQKFRLEDEPDLFKKPYSVPELISTRSQNGTSVHRRFGSTSLDELIRHFSRSIEKNSNQFNEAKLKQDSMMRHKLLELKKQVGSGTMTFSDANDSTASEE